MTQASEVPCNCYRIPHAFYCAKLTGDAGGWWDTPEGRADAADLVRMDREEARRNG